MAEGKTHVIKKVQFGILGPDEIRNMSVTQKTNARERAVDAGITKYETYVDGKGVYGGVNDPRMGNLDDKDDPGHFGHIEVSAASVKREKRAENTPLRSSRGPATTWAT